VFGLSLEFRTCVVSKTLISEARKFRIATTLSHQILAQLDEANKAAAIAAGNLIVFRVSGEDAKTLAKNFDTTPTKEIIGEEPIRAPVSDVISHLVTRGYNDARVASFAQIYLKNLENFVSKPPHVGLYGPPVVQRDRRKCRSATVALIGLPDTRVAVEHGLSPSEAWEKMGRLCQGSMISERIHPA
jgi:hypothetical protein